MKWNCITKSYKRRKIELKNSIFDLVFKYQLEQRTKNDFLPNDYKVFHSKSEIESWSQTYFDYFDNLKNQVRVLQPPKEKELIFKVLSFYAGREHSILNDFLRGNPIIGSIDNVKKRSRILKNEIQKFRLSDNLIAVRRIKNIYAPTKKSNGENSIDEGFMSTSLDLNYRLNIEGRTELLENETIIVIKIPKGTNAIYLSPVKDIDQDLGEYELLLQCGQRFRIDKEIRILGNRIMFIELT